MEVIITRESVLSEIEKLCDSMKLSSETREKLIKQLNIDYIFNYFTTINKDTIRELFRQIDEVGQSDLTNPKNSLVLFILLVKKEVLGLIIYSLLKQKNEIANMTEEEKINMLIDLKTSIKLEGIDLVISNTLEDEIN